MTERIPPVLRYYGSKWSIAPKIIAHFPPHKTYVEPFGGSAAVLLAKEPSFNEVYNDLDDDIVNLFRVLRDPVANKELKQAVVLTPFSRTEFENAYLGDDDTPVERARKCLIRSWMGHGNVGATRKTGFRTNSTRNSRSSFPRDWVRVERNIEATAQRLRNVTIECVPAIDCIRGHDALDTLFYVDPPYMASVRKDRVYRHEMVDSEAHIELAEVLHSLKGMVILSGYADILYHKLYELEGWQTIDIATHTHLYRPRTERLWIKPHPILNDIPVVQSTLF